MIVNFDNEYTIVNNQLIGLLGADKAILLSVLSKRLSDTEKMAQHPEDKEHGNYARFYQLGKWWTKFNIDQYREKFHNAWDVVEISKMIKSLEKLKIIEKVEFQPTPDTQETWYTVNLETLNRMIETRVK